ncbi:MAG: plastocyanin/azurin family copper-binding protein [Candidatus Caldarchaeum sp.]
MKSVLAVVAVAASALLFYTFLYGLGGENRSESGSATVFIRLGSYREDAATTYDPPTVRVVLRVNNTVVWVNEDITVHDVTHEPCMYNEQGCIKTFKSKLLETGESFSYTFTQPGRYDYRCSPHPWMRGTVVVEAGGRS